MTITLQLPLDQVNNVLAALNHLATNCGNTAVAIQQQTASQLAASAAEQTPQG
jgi:hypothetical protein